MLGNPAALRFISVSITSLLDSCSNYFSLLTPVLDKLFFAKPSGKRLHKNRGLNNSKLTKNSIKNLLYKKPSGREQVHKFVHCFSSGAFEVIGAIIFYNIQG